MDEHDQEHHQIVCAWMFVQTCMILCVCVCVCKLILYSAAVCVLWCVLPIVQIIRGLQSQKMFHLCRLKPLETDTFSKMKDVYFFRLSDYAF